MQKEKEEEEKQQRLTQKMRDKEQRKVRAVPCCKPSLEDTPPVPNIAALVAVRPANVPQSRASLAVHRQRGRSSRMKSGSEARGSGRRHLKPKKRQHRSLKSKESSRASSWLPSGQSWTPSRPRSRTWWDS